jgi:hypothetical protein
MPHPATLASNWAKLEENEMADASRFIKGQLVRDTTLKGRGHGTIQNVKEDPCQLGAPFTYELEWADGSTESDVYPSEIESI